MTTVSLPRRRGGLVLSWAPESVSFAGLLVEGVKPDAAAAQAGVAPEVAADLLADPLFRGAVRGAITVPAPERNISDPDCNLGRLAERLQGAQRALELAQRAADAAPAGVAREDRLDDVRRAELAVQALKIVISWAEGQADSARHQLRRLANVDDSKTSALSLHRWRDEIRYNRRIIETLTGEKSALIKLEV